MAIYNPSIFAAINRLLNKQMFTRDEFIHHNDSYHSFMHHGSFSNINHDDAVVHVNEEFSLASKQLNVADFLHYIWHFLCFSMKETGTTLHRHKIPANQFVRQRLTVDDYLDLEPAY